MIVATWWWSKRPCAGQNLHTHTWRPWSWLFQVGQIHFLHSKLIFSNIVDIEILNCQTEWQIEDNHWEFFSESNIPTGRPPWEYRETNLQQVWTNSTSKSIANWFVIIYFYLVYNCSISPYFCRIGLRGHIGKNVVILFNNVFNMIPTLAIQCSACFTRFV